VPTMARGAPTSYSGVYINLVSLDADCCLSFYSIGGSDGLILSCTVTSSLVFLQVLSVSNQAGLLNPLLLYTVF
jgi:hypothetical protein